MKELGGGGVEGWRGSQPLCSLCFTGGGGGGGGAEPDPEASLAVKLASFHLPASPHPSLSLSTPPPHLSAFISASLPPLILLLLLPPSSLHPANSILVCRCPLLPLHPLKLSSPTCSTLTAALACFFYSSPIRSRSRSLPHTPPSLPLSLSPRNHVLLVSMETDPGRMSVIMTLICLERLVTIINTITHTHTHNITSTQSTSQSSCDWPV